ncbi:MAG: hypothetical protein HOV77_06740 [Hamadaea sp.]|uniref:hypothetical protein n=1 Tax=Hamadaea sp. TaxID=2024425 RepID=UPI001810A8D7|nr:hypothetical protein [Hamadaea sp.]NUT18864.1 hypothetical protein [Hamadaea sp.]
MVVMGTRHPARSRWKVWNAFTVWILHSPRLHRLADRQVCELRFRARRSRREIALPVMYAQHGDTLVILVGRPDAKRWWRNFRQPHRTEVLLRGVVRTGTGRIVGVDAPQRSDAARIYASRFPDLAVEDDPLVVIDLDPATS